MTSFSSPGGGSGGTTIVSSSTTSYEWETLRNIDLSSYSDTDWNTAGEKTLGGYNYQVVLPTSALAIDVGTTYGGIKIAPVVATSQRLYTSTRSAPHVWTKIGQFLSGTNAYERPDYELRISVELGYEGTINRASYEGLIIQLASNTYNAGPFQQFVVGSYLDTNNFLENITPGTAVGATFLDAATTPALAYFPPCLRVSILQGMRKYEYSNDGATLATASWETLSWALNSTAQDNPRLSTFASSQGSELILLFGVNKYNAGGTVTSMTLKRIILEGRISPTGNVVTYW